MVEIIEGIFVEAEVWELLTSDWFVEYDTNREPYH